MLRGFPCSSSEALSTRSKVPAKHVRRDHKQDQRNWSFIQVYTQILLGDHHTTMDPYTVHYLSPCYARPEQNVPGPKSPHSPCQYVVHITRTTLSPQGLQVLVHHVGHQLRKIPLVYFTLPLLRSSYAGHLQHAGLPVSQVVRVNSQGSISWNSFRTCRRHNDLSSRCQRIHHVVHHTNLTRTKSQHWTK